MVKKIKTLMSPSKSRGPKPVTVSLHPLTPENAMSAFMQIDPKRILKRELAKQKQRSESRKIKKR